MQITLKILFIFALSSIGLSLPTQESAVEPSARIVNGFEIDITSIPYHAALRRRLSAGWAYTCGASVISNRALLTAAHCVLSYENQPSLLKVIVGTNYRVSGGKTYDLSRVIPHYAYDTETLVNDIAILVTSKDMNFSQSVKPISIAPSYLDLPSGTQALVSGFGVTEYTGVASPILLAANVKIVAQDICARAYMRITTLSDSMICANATNPPRDACQGDSGGPLVSSGVLVGIVSWGEGCAEANYPGVYTKVSSHYNWITLNLSYL